MSASYKKRKNYNSINDAIEKGDYGYVKDFLVKGGNPNISYGRGKCKLPLHVAIKIFDLEMVKLLLDYGADPYLEHNYSPSLGDHNWKNALDIAVSESNDEIVNELLRRGMDPNVKNKEGNKPLFYAVGPSKIELLLEAGADPNGQYYNGNTPLHRAVIRKNIEALMTLLNDGSDVFVLNNDHKTPLQLAEEVDEVEDIEELRDLEEIIELLRRAEYDQDSIKGALERKYY